MTLPFCSPSSHLPSIGICRRDLPHSLCGTGEGAQGLMCGRQTLYQQSHISGPFTVILAIETSDLIETHALMPPVFEHREGKMESSALTVQHVSEMK